MSQLVIHDEFEARCWARMLGVSRAEVVAAFGVATEHEAQLEARIEAGQGAQPGGRPLGSETAAAPGGQAGDQAGDPPQRA